MAKIDKTYYYCAECGKINTLIMRPYNLSGNGCCRDSGNIVLIGSSETHLIKWIRWHYKKNGKHRFMPFKKPLTVDEAKKVLIAYMI